MSRSVFMSLLVAFLFLGCTSLKDIEDNPEFSKVTDKFFQEFWPLHPEMASAKGLTDYEKELSLPNEETRSKRLTFYKEALSKFETFPIEDLSIDQRIDRSMLINEMKKRIWSLEEYKDFQWDPSEHNVGMALSYVLNKSARPLEERLKDLSEKLLLVKPFYQAAEESVNNPTKVHTEHAIDQTKGLIRYLKGDVTKQIKKSKLPRRDQSTLEQRVGVAASAARGYIRFLRGVLSNPKKVGGFRDFRIDPETYAKKFEYDLQISFTPEELYKKALDAKQDLRSKMFESAIALYPKYFGEKLPPKDRQNVVTSVLAKVSKQHPKRGEFIDKIKEQLPELKAFIKKHNLVSLDESQPLKVRETPPYLKGYAGASVEAPGPFNKKDETYYNVTPLDRMTAKQAESYLREYNNYMLQILNIHEALPGHYVQSVYANKTNSLVRSVFYNGALVEGWAVYAERMMMEQGYAEKNQELWLVYYKWLLRSVTNTILDYEIHHKNLSKEDAMKMMMVGAYQEKSEAEGKWHRAKLKQVQLASYFGGFTAIYELREKLKKEKEEDFKLKQFHEEFLSYGRAPIQEIKQFML